MRSVYTKLLVALVLMLCMVSSLLVPAYAELDEPIMLDNCDNSTWHGSKSKDFEEKTEGTASVSWDVAVGGSFVVHRTWATPVDGSGANFLEFDIYVSSADAFYSISGGNSLEMTSGGVCDVEETAWNLTSLELEDGWNHVALGIGAGGGCDLSRINYMRFYALGHNNDEPYTVKIDNIRLTYIDPDDIEGVEVPDDYIIGLASPETAIPVMRVSDHENEGDDDGDDESKPTQGEEPTPDPRGCGVVMQLGTGAVLLLAAGVSSVLIRKKNARG